MAPVQSVCMVLCPENCPEILTFSWPEKMFTVPRFASICGCDTAKNRERISTKFSGSDAKRTEKKRLTFGNVQDDIFDPESKKPSIFHGFLAISRISKRMWTEIS